jgi:hypothetical protein
LPQGGRRRGGISSRKDGHVDDPTDTLVWEHAADLGRPFSAEALDHARRLAVETQRFPDTKRALVELLDRWGAGLTTDATERRIALRLSQNRLRIIDGDAAHHDDAEAVSSLPSVRRLAAVGAGINSPTTSPPLAPCSADPANADSAEVGGDDDEDDEWEADAMSSGEAVAMTDMEFYADPMDLL